MLCSQWDSKYMFGERKLFQINTWNNNLYTIILDDWIVLYTTPFKLSM